MPHPYTHGHFYWNELMTRDAEKAKKFYSGTVGWTFEAMKMPDGASWVAKIGDVPVGGLFPLTSPQFDECTESWMSYLAVDDVDARVKKAQVAGATLGGRDASRSGQVRRMDHGSASSPAEDAVQEGGRRIPRPDPQPTGPTRTRASHRRRNWPARSTARRYARCGPDGSNKVLLGGEQLAGFAQLRDDGRPRVAAGSSPAPSTRPATRWRGATTPIPTNRPDPELGVRGRPTGASLQSRILRSAASRGIRRANWSRGTARVGRRRRPDIRPRQARPGHGPSSCPEGVARLFARGMAEGPFPSTTNRSKRRWPTPLTPNDPRQSGGPRVQGRHGELRRRQGVSVRRHAPIG